MGGRDVGEVLAGAAAGRSQRLHRAVAGLHRFAQGDQVEARERRGIWLKYVSFTFRRLESMTVLNKYVILMLLLLLHVNFSMDSEEFEGFNALLVL